MSLSIGDLSPLLRILNLTVISYPRNAIIRYASLALVRLARLSRIYALQFLPTSSSSLACHVLIVSDLSQNITCALGTHRLAVVVFIMLNSFLDSFHQWATRLLHLSDLVTFISRGRCIGHWQSLRGYPGTYTGTCIYVSSPSTRRYHMI